MMATRVLPVDHSSMDGDCETSGTEIPGHSTAKKAAVVKAIPPVQSNANHQHKKAHRRKPSKKKRKWKPYSKMSWEERKALDEKEKQRANRIRAEMLGKGRPVAPYNTTQFLMEEHDPFDSDTFDPSSGYREAQNVSANGSDEGDSCSDGDPERIDGHDRDVNGNNNAENNYSIVDEVEGSMENYTDSPHMVPEFISQDFSETYERVHEESLQTMTRDELMSEHMDLERKLSILQDQLATEKSVRQTHEKKIQVVEHQMETLKAENVRLTNENEILRSDKASFSAGCNNVSSVPASLPSQRFSSDTDNLTQENDQPASAGGMSWTCESSGNDNDAVRESFQRDMSEGSLEQRTKQQTRINNSVLQSSLRATGSSEPKSQKYEALFHDNL